MNFFSNNKKDNEKTKLDSATSTPVVAEKTKDSAGFLKKSLSKIGDLIKSTPTGSKLSNTEYLGEIYKLMVVRRETEKLSRQKQINRRKEEAYEEERRHKEIIKALSLKRRKPKKVRAKRPAETGLPPGLPPGIPFPKPQPPKPQPPKPQPEPPKPQPPKPQPEPPKPQPPRDTPIDDAAEMAAKREAERRAIEEAERKAAQEAERRAAERKAAEEAERRAAERKAAEEAERRAKQEAERKAAEEAAKRERELTDDAADNATKRNNEIRERQDRSKESKKSDEEAARQREQQQQQQQQREQQQREQQQREQQQREQQQREQQQQQREQQREQQRQRDRQQQRDRDTAERDRLPPPGPTAQPVRLPPGLPATMKFEQGYRTREAAIVPFKYVEEQPKKNADGTIDPREQKRVNDINRDRKAKKVSLEKLAGLPVGEDIPKVGAATRDPTRGTSYGSFGISNVRTYDAQGNVTGTSSMDAFLKLNPQFKKSPSNPDGLPNPGSNKEPELKKKFDEAWWKLAKERPEELFDAQAEYYRTNYYLKAAALMQGVTNAEIKNFKVRSPGGEAIDVRLDPTVQSYMTDRLVVGMGGIPNALKAAKNEKTIRDYVIQLATNDLKKLRRYFTTDTTLASFLSQEKGLRKRVVHRLIESLRVGELDPLTSAEKDELFKIDSLVGTSEYEDAKKIREEKGYDPAGGRNDANLDSEDVSSIDNQSDIVTSLSKDNNSMLKSLRDSFGTTFAGNRVTNINVIQEEEFAPVSIDDRPAFLRKNTYG